MTMRNRVKRLEGLRAPAEASPELEVVVRRTVVKPGPNGPERVRVRVSRYRWRAPGGPVEVTHAERAEP